MGNNDPHSIFASPDDMKLRSCMTLFDVVEPDSIFAKVLEKFFQGKKDSRTMTILKEQSYPIHGYIVERVNNVANKTTVDKRTLVLISAICGDINIFTANRCLMPQIS